MARNNRISATRPVFPSFLLPSFRFTLHRRRRSPSSSSSAATSSPGSDGNAVCKSTPSCPRRLARLAPDTLRCMACSTDLALTSQIISKGFTGRYGRAFLVAPPAPPAEQALINIRLGRSEDRQLVTGWHVVADICCATCSRKLGWKYVDAREQSQKYKVGKYILEVERVVTHRSWDDSSVEHMGIIKEGAETGAEPGASDGHEGSALDKDEVVFDSEDEEECEDIFAGVWNAETVAKRRSQTVARRATMA